MQGLRRRRRGQIAAVVLTILVPTLVMDAAHAGVITRRAALNRPDVVAVSGDVSDRWRVCPATDRTYDLRGLRSIGSFDDLANLSVGNDCAEDGVVTVGGAAVGTMSHALTWEEVKATYDAAGLRFEGTSWLASFGASLVDVEDGFAPRVTEGTEGDNDVRFLLSSTYMDWIRDDAIENDDLMSGAIRNVLIDGTNRFLSARPREGDTYTNHHMVVQVHDVLVHMKAMPMEDAHGGTGFGGIFKWSDAAGAVDVSNAIFLLDEAPISHEPFPPGTYAHVKLVLGYAGRYPGNLPDGVSTTHRLGVWKRARHRWIRAHARAMGGTRTAAGVPGLPAPT
jgi:hypothetical protein